MELIGLNGFARSGKDEAAKILVEEFGFTRVSFADKLRDVLYALNPWVRGYKNGMIDWRLLQDVIDEYTWDGYKETSYDPEIRRLLQRLGTEAGRQTLWDTIWIDATLTGFAPDAKIVVSDARFINEFEAVRSRGGEVWRIDRAGVGPANDHASETEALTYDKFARFINNNSDLDNYRGVIKRVYADFVSDRTPKSVKKKNSQFTSGISVSSQNVPKRR